jgi:hypothetical protein
MKVNVEAIYQNGTKGHSIVLICPDTVKKRLHDHLDLHDKGGQWLLKGHLETMGKQKSPEQMGYYYAEVLPKALYGFIEAGYYTMTEYDAHEALKSMFFSDTVPNIKTGEILNIPRSLADADMDDLRQYIDKCIAFVENELQTPIDPPYDRNK